MTNKIDIQKRYSEMLDSQNSKNIDSWKVSLRMYVNGGYEGLNHIYYNYYNNQGVKFKDIYPFEQFVENGDINEFYLDGIFIEVDNKYLTNVGCNIKSLCDYYSNSEKSIENKKVDIISIVNRLEEEIYKSATSQYNDNPKLYDVLKRIENYYRIAYSEIYNDFYSFLTDRPVNQTYSKNFLHVFTPIKENIPLKIAVLFFTGQILIVDNNHSLMFLYEDKLYKSVSGLAKVLEIKISEKWTTIKTYLNETLKNKEYDKNIYYSDKVQDNIHKYCTMNGLKITHPQWIKKQYENGTNS